jgi:hypothetical protein
VKGQKAFSKKGEDGGKGMEKREKGEKGEKGSKRTIPMHSQKNADTNALTKAAQTQF